MARVLLLDPRLLAAVWFTDAGPEAVRGEFKYYRATVAAFVRDPRRQAWPGHRLGVERRTLRLGEIVEPVLA